MAKRKQGRKKINSCEEGQDLAKLIAAPMIPYCKIKDEPREQEEEITWSYLPEGILDLIISHLNISECIRSSRVCKYWRTIVCTTPKFRRPCSYGNPCLLRFSLGSKKCVLVDPLGEDEEFIIDTPNLPHNVHIACSNYGWLLLIAGKDGKQIFFFNPLTQAIIKLPDKQFPTRYMFNFSAPPTSPDCIIVALLASNDLSQVCYCQPRENEWTRFDVDHEESNFKGSYSRPIFFMDRIYHLGLDGRLGIYDLLDESMTIIGKRIKKPHKTTDRFYLVEMNDDQLISIFVDADVGLVRIFMFDDPNDQWVKLESIGDKLLFVGPIDCTWTKSITDVHERVYLPMLCKGDVMSFSCESNQLYPTRKIYDRDVYEFGRTACWIELMS